MKFNIETLETFISQSMEVLNKVKSQKQSIYTIERRNIPHNWRHRLMILGDKVVLRIYVQGFVFATNSLYLRKKLYFPSELQPLPCNSDEGKFRSLCLQTVVHIHKEWFMHQISSRHQLILHISNSSNEPSKFAWDPTKINHIF